MIKRMLIMLVAAGLVLGAVFGFIEFKSRMTRQFMASQGEPPQTVSTLTAQYQDWLPELKAVGTLRAVQGVELSAEVPGVVGAIHFEQGADVAANAPLLALRADDLKARLKSLLATAELARITYQRDQAQFDARTISRQTLDADRAQLDAALANVAEQQALLDKKTIRAPFAGRVGLRAVDSGQYLDAGTVITTLQALDTLYVDFFVPQQHIAALKPGLTVKLKSDSHADQVFVGELAVINPKVDVKTRNVQLRAIVKNPERQLLPGMYAMVTIVAGEAQRYITVPRSALSFNSYGSTVFVVGKRDAAGKQLAEQRFVTTGASRGDQIAIVNGVNEGDLIVTAGQIKLRNGTPVLIDNSVQPSNDANPSPVDQ